MPYSRTTRKTESQGIALVQGQPVRYRVRRSDRARRVHVSVSRREGVVVVLPPRAPRREVAAMLAEVEAWLARQVRIHGVAEGPIRRTYATGSALGILGVPRRLELRPLSSGRRRAREILTDDKLTMELPVAELLDPRPALERTLRRLAGRYLRERVRVLAERIGLAPARVIVGERTTRWGSCSPSGTLSFCYRLIMAPPGVIDAVVAHEICHLRHLNHGRRFQRLVRLACPDHDACMAWLRDHEADLEL